MFIIVSTSVLTLLLLVWSLWFRRMYRSTQRVAENVEEITGIVLNRVAKPLVTLPPLMDTVRDVFGFVQDLRTKDRTEDEEEDKE